MRRFLAPLLVPVLLAAACDETPAGEQAGGGAAEQASGPGLVVLTTVDPITDLARQVVGDRGEVRSLVDAGDSHTFEPTPQDAIAMSEADLFLANGLGLNESAVALAETNLPEGAPIVTLADLALATDDIIVGEEGHTHGGDTHTHTHGDGDEAPNPHAWMDVTHAIAYVGHIADALADIDPEGEETYRANAAAYTAELEALDAAILEATATIPEENRVLVSYHDSWAYYAPRYGLEHIDAIQPSDYAEPSAAEVRAIVDEINAQGVPAVFGAREFPSDVLGTIAAETGATYIGDLSDDELPGEPGDPAHSYIGMMLENAFAITEGLGGDPSPLDAITPTG